MERENRKFYEDQDGVVLVWDIVNGVTERVFFEYEDGEEDILWSGISCDEAERVFSKALEYLQSDPKH